jgi:hypothetical protein
MTVGGNQYIVLGQGGHHGSLLFFSPDNLLTPKLDSDVNEHTGGGEVMFTGKQRLGYINGQQYYLQYDATTGYTTAAGAWDFPPPPSTSSGTTPSPAPSDQASDSDTNLTSPEPDATTSSPAGNGPSIESIRTTLRSGNYQPNPESNKLTDELKKQQIEFWTYSKSGTPPLGYWHVWIFPAKLLKARNMPMPMPADIPISATPDGLQVINGHFVAITRSYETLFYDLSKPLKVKTAEGKPQNHPFDNVGKIDQTSFNISDEGLLKSALDLGKFPLNGKTGQDVETNLAAVMKNRQQGEAYTITGGMDSGTMSLHLGGERLFGQFWPTIDAKLNSAGGQESNSTPQHAFDYSSAPSAGDLPDETYIDSTEKITMVSTAGDGKSAKLYANGDGSKLYFAFQLSLDGGKTVNESGYTLAFVKEAKDLQLPIPSCAAKDIQVQGLLKAKSAPSPKTRSLGTKERGLVYAVYNDALSSSPSAQGTIDTKKNCAGPLIWWGKGMDEKTAFAYCQKDKL